MYDISFLGSITKTGQGWGIEPLLQESNTDVVSGDPAAMITTLAASVPL